jgi:integrase
LQAIAGLQYGRSEAEESEPIKPVPESFVDAVVDVVAPPVAAMIELQRLTGMRSGEVIAMRACDLDTAGKVWIYRPAAHKNRWRGHERLVFLGPKAQAIVRPFLKPNLQAFLFSPADAVEAQRAERHRDRTTPAGYGNTRGTNRKAKPKRSAGDHYDVAAYRRAIARGCRRAKVPHWHPHQLRHNHGTTVRREFGLEIARILLGHKNANVTEIYAEADTAKAVEIAGKIG